MIIYFYDENRNKAGIDIEAWNDAMLPLFSHGELYYQFEGNAIVDIESLSKKMVVPTLFYTLLEMSEVLDESLESETITSDLLEANREPAPLDNYDMLSLNYLQAEFVNKYEKEVKAWMPLAIKKYVRANNKQIKDVLSGRV